MLPGKKTSEEEVQADLAEHLRNPGKSGPVLGGFASASRPEAMNKALSKDKRYDTYKGLTLKETNTLLRADVPDITTAEMRLLYERSGQRQPVWISASDKAKFKSKGAERIQWEQGGQNIEVAANSETRRIAETTMSRLEGGISGSTDLMFHAGKHLGFTDAADLKRLRLALVAWMLSNRDHSFFEIMKVAADYGPPFNIDPNNLGSEYETQDNFSPLTGQQVANFSLLMPGHHMPSYYLGVVHKGTVDAGVAKGTTGDTYVGDLRTAGLVLDDTWKADPKSKDLAQWLELKSAVGGLSMQAAQTEGALKQNRVAVQALQKDPAWHHVNKPAVDAHADANLRALIAHSHGAAAVVSDGDLTNIGVPPALLTGLEEYKRYDIMRLRRAVDAGAKGLKGPTSNAHEAGVAKLCNSPAYAAVKHWVGGATAFLFLQSMLAAKLGNVRSTAGEKAAAVDGPLLVNFLNAHPGVNAQKAHLVSLGLPRSVADHVETRLRDGIDSSDRTPGVIFFRLEQLRTAVTAAGLVAGQPPTSTANKAARKTIRRSEAYRNVSSYVGAAATEACLTAFVIANIGARATTAGEDENLFRNTGQIDILTAAGIPRDLIEGNYRLRQPFENLRRAAVDAGFNTAQPPTHVANTTAWTKLTTGKAFTDLLVHLDNNQATAYAAALVKSQVGPAVLGPSQKMLAKATEQRMANEDKLRLGKTAVMDTTTLQTPTMHGEAPDPLQTAAREERYWATAAADTDLTINIGAGAKSPTIKAQLTLWKTHLRNTPGDLATEINTACTRWVASQPDPKPTVKDAKDMFFPDTDSTAEQIDNLMTMIPGPELLDHVSPEVKAAVQAIQALSPRERGAIYQYTNKLHDQLGYATQSFSMATDFTAHDLSTTTDKLRAVPFMLPILQALNSALGAASRLQRVAGVQRPKEQCEQPRRQPDRQVGPGSAELRRHQLQGGLGAQLQLPLEHGQGRRRIVPFQAWLRRRPVHPAAPEDRAGHRIPVEQGQREGGPVPSGCPFLHRRRQSSAARGHPGRRQHAGQALGHPEGDLSAARRGRRVLRHQRLDRRTPSKGRHAAGHVRRGKRDLSLLRGGVRGQGPAGLLRRSARPGAHRAPRRRSHPGWTSQLRPDHWQLRTGLRQRRAPLPGRHRRGGWRAHRAHGQVDGGRRLPEPGLLPLCFRGRRQRVREPC